MLYETKVTCPISATAANGSARQGKAGMQCAFGNSDKYYKTKILGTPLGEGKLPAGGDYLMALTREPNAVCQTAVEPYHVESSGATVMRPRTKEFWAVWGLPSMNEYQKVSFAR